MASLSDLQNKRIAILGFGQEGQAIANYLIANSVIPEIYDGKDISEWKDDSLSKLKQLDLKSFCAPDFIDQAISNVDIIFRSPGIKISLEQQNNAAEKNLLITSQTQWFFEHSPAKIIGVTGTKGKGTTCSLIFEMLNNETIDRKIFLTGNIGKVQPFEFIDDLSENDIVVYELSSFQLQDLKMSPHIGVCLMVTSDHLDYHNDLNEYYLAKSAIAKFQTAGDILIYNEDYQATKQIAELGTGKKWPISKRKLESFPRVLINEQEEKIEVVDQDDESLVIETAERLLRGKHNLENIAAASTVAVSLKVPVSKIQVVVNSFSGLKHRLQFVTEKDGIEYYNDSVSTNPDTTIAAIRSFSKPIVLIVGGAVKNLDYSKLAELIANSENIKSVITMGPAGKIIADLLSTQGNTKSVIGPLYDFKEIIEAAQNIVASGDIVLLSPGATSFDMFNSYTERGDQFIKLVSE